MFPDFPTEETKHTVKFDEEVFPLPAHAMEDKLPRSPELVLQPGPYDVSGSLKRQINTSTESSAGDADLEHPWRGWYQKRKRRR